MPKLKNPMILMPFIFSLALAASCKPVGEESDSAVKADTGGTQEIVAGDHLVWSLATYLRRSTVGDEKKLAKHIGVSGKELYFTSNENPVYPAVVAEEAALRKSSEISPSVKTFLSKEKLRVTTNLEVSTSPNLKIVATWWMDVAALGKKISNSGSRSMEFVAQGAMTDTDANFKPTASATFRAYGIDVKSYTVTDIKPLALNVPLPKMAASPVIYGVASVGFTAEIGLKPVVSINLDLDYRAKHILAFTIVPKASIVAHIGAGAKATSKITAKALGELDVVAGEWPFTVSLGGSTKDNLIYGGATYDGQNFKALQGRLVLVAKVGLANGLLPAGVDKFIWTGIRALFAKVKIALPAIYKDWEARHVIWESQPLTISKTPGFGGKAFYKIFNNPTAAKCKEAEAIVLNHIAGLKKDVKGDTLATAKEANASAQAMLVKVDTKIKANCK